MNAEEQGRLEEELQAKQMAKCEELMKKRMMMEQDRLLKIAAKEEMMRKKMEEEVMRNQIDKLILFSIKYGRTSDK